jgi:flagellar biosynthetic protein FliR
MLAVTSAQLDAWLAAFIFPLARIFGLMASAPIFSNAGVPRRTRLIAGLAVTLAIAPMIPQPPAIPAGSWLGIFIIMQQIIIGVIMGFAMRIAFATVDVAGELIGLQMGLSFAVAYDPLSAGQTPVLTEFMGLITALMFLAMNGHLMLLSGLMESFRLVPIGLVPFKAPAFAELLRWSSVIFASGLMISLPLIAALLIANIALGVLSRVAPSLNLFAIGFPVTLAIGYLVLMFSLPYFGAAMARLFDQGFTAMEQILRAGATPL